MQASEVSRNRFEYRNSIFTRLYHMAIKCVMGIQSVAPLWSLNPTNPGKGYYLK